MRRRTLFAGAAASTLTFVGCAAPNASMPPSLADAQVWAASVAGALSLACQELISEGTIKGETATQAQAAAAALSLAAADFVALQPGATNAGVVASGVAAAVQKLLPLLPVRADVVQTTQIGIAVLVSFAAAVPIVIPFTPTVSHTRDQWPQQSAFG